MQVNLNISNRVLIIVGAVIVLGALGLWLLQDKPDQESNQTTPAKGLSVQQQSLGMRLLSSSDDISDYIRSQMKICYDNGGQNSCYKEAGQLLFDQFGYQKVLDTFKQTEELPEIFSRCHEVTHYLGRSAYKETKSIPTLYNQDRSECHGGFYHGVIEGYFADKNLLLSNEPTVELASNIKTVCGQAGDYPAPRFYAECVHGIGHAMMYITEQELPQSLKYCDALATRGDQETCYGGALMENSSSSTNFDHPTKYLRADDPNYPCTILDEHYLPTCYQYQSSYFAEISRWDWRKVVLLCEGVPIAYQAGCFHFIGTNQVGYTQDPQIWRKDCNYIANASYRASCVTGVIASLGGRYVGQADLMLNFCNIVDGDMREPCFRSTGNVASTWSQGGGQRDQVCAKIEDPVAMNWCKQG